MSIKTNYSALARLVIDESIGVEERQLALTWLEQRGLVNPAITDIKTEYSGLADERIQASLLGPATLLITCDRPFHNAVLANGLHSLWVRGQEVSPHPLPGIIPTPTSTRVPEKLQPGTLFHPPSLPLRPLIMPIEEKELKTLTQRRRRIRNHFGGLQNLTELAVTTSTRPIASGILMGVRLRVIAGNGMKALDASESYIAENCKVEWGPSAALCHSLIIPIQLLLFSLKTTVFHDGPMTGVAQPYREAFDELSASYPALILQACSKGPHMERLRDKLVALSRGGTNEVRPSRLPEYLARLGKHRPGEQYN